MIETIQIRGMWGDRGKMSVQGKTLINTQAFTTRRLTLDQINCWLNDEEQ